MATVTVRSHGHGLVTNLVELSSEEVEGGHDTAVGAEFVLLHDLFVVDGVANIDVAAVGELGDGGVEVDDVGGDLLFVDVDADA
eukprot:1904841-Rhodomonas_salina.1